jgi:hypothetical protein
MRRELNRVDSGANRMGGGAVARGTRGRRMTGAAAVGGGGVGGMLKGAATFGGIYGIVGEIKKAKQFEEVLVDVAVRGGKTKRWMDQLRSSMLATSNEFGIGKDQLAAYVGTIIDQTGNTRLATETLRDMTAVAYSANVPMGQLAGTVVELQSKLGLAPKQFTEAMGILAAQADKGKVPLSQMSQYLPEVLNATTQFGHTGVRALRDYGAVLQMAARGAGSLAEANTAMNRMLDQTAAKRAKIEKTLGIKLKKNGAWMQLGPMLKEIVGGLLKMKAEGKDVEKFIVSTWGIRGKKAILPMMQQGAKGWGGRVGSDASGGGGLTSFDALVGAGGAGTIGERVARKRKLSPELDRWNKGVERLKNKLHTHLLPALKKLGDIIPSISTALEWMIDNWKMLLVVWGSAKMVRFLNSMVSLVGGGGGSMLGGLGKLLGVGGAAAGGGGATAGGGAAVATVGGGGLIGGLTAAGAALGGFTLAIAPAVAGLKAMGDAYDPQKQKELRDRLTKEARKQEGKSLHARLKRIQAGVGEGAWTSIDELQNETHEQKRERLTRLKYQMRPSQTKSLLGAAGQIRQGKHGEAAFQIGQFGRDKLKQIASASDYELTGMGLTRDIVTELMSVMKMSQSRLDAAEARHKEFAAWAKKTGEQKVVVKIIDPNKTPAAVTDSRRSAK